MYKSGCLSLPVQFVSREAGLLHSIHCVPQELMGIFLASKSEMLSYPFQFIKNTNGFYDISRVGEHLDDVILHGTHHAKPRLMTCFGMLSGQHVVGKGSRVGQTLQGRVKETCVAQVMETCSNAVALVPFQAEPLWGKQDLLRKSNAIPTVHHHLLSGPFDLECCVITTINSRSNGRGHTGSLGS